MKPWGTRSHYVVPFYLKIPYSAGWRTDHSIPNREWLYPVTPKIACNRPVLLVSPESTNKRFHYSISTWGFFVLFCSPIGLLLEETIRSFLSQLSPNNYYWTIPGESLGSRTGESWSKLIKDEQRNNLDGLPLMRDWTGHQKRFVANRTIWRARPGGAVVHRLHFQPAHMSWLHQNSGCEWCSTPAQRQENRTGED